MADVSITIRKSVEGSETNITVNSKIDDSEVDPIVNQLAQLLYTSASVPTPAPAA